MNTNNERNVDTMTGPTLKEKSDIADLLTPLAAVLQVPVAVVLFWLSDINSMIHAESSQPLITFAIVLTASCAAVWYTVLHFGTKVLTSIIEERNRLAGGAASQ